MESGIAAPIFAQKNTEGSMGQLCTYSTKWGGKHSGNYSYLWG